MAIVLLTNHPNKGIIMSKKKILSIVILALGVCLIVSGIILLFHNGDHCGYSGGVSRASTSIEFGADFYTSSAQYTGLAANATVDLYRLLSIVSGIFFIFVGGIDVCITLFFTDVKNLFKSEKVVETILDNCSEEQ